VERSGARPEGARGRRLWHRLPDDQQPRRSREIRQLDALRPARQPQLGADPRFPLWRRRLPRQGQRHRYRLWHDRDCRGDGKSRSDPFREGSRRGLCRPLRPVHLPRLGPRRRQARSMDDGRTEESGRCVPATAAIGRITLSPAPDQPFSPTVPWLAHRPDGTLVDCAGTQTSCFQEAENEAFAKGWSIDVYGSGGAVVSGINAVRGIVLHPLRQRYIALHGVIISCAVTDEPCLTVDSMVEGALILNNGAQITSTPKTASARTFTILFQPKNKLDPEGFAAVA